MSKNLYRDFHEFLNIIYSELEDEKQLQIIPHLKLLYETARDNNQTWLQFFTVIKNDTLFGCKLFTWKLTKKLEIHFKFPPLYFLTFRFDLSKLNFTLYDISIETVDEKFVVKKVFRQNGGKPRQWKIQYLGNVTDGF